jgi:diguanylate cyclase (GGDEF)-like protein/PAS domain S-box-containing protein
MKTKKKRSSTARRKRAPRTTPPAKSTKTKRRSPRAGSTRRRTAPLKASIRESDLLRTVMDNSVDLIYFKDTDGRFVRINRPLAEHLSLRDPERAVGKTDFDFFPEEHARQTLADERKIIADGRPLEGMEKRIRWPDKRVTWVSTTKSPVRNASGRIIGTLGVSRDITNRKDNEDSIRKINRVLEETNRSLKAEIAERCRAEEELARERDLFRTLMDNTTDRIYFKDRESRFTLINRSTAAFLGLSDPTQAEGKTDFDFFTDVHARQAFDDEQRIIAEGKPMVGVEEKETWPDGRETWVSTSKIPLRDPEQRTVGTFGISRDITEQKRSEEERIRTAALREANVELEKINAALQIEIAERERVEQLLERERDLFRAMMDNTTDRIYFKDRDSQFLLINHSLALHFGISDPAEAVGKRDFDFFSEEHAQQAFDDEQRLVASETPFLRKEEKETWPDGRITWVSTTKFPMRDRSGRIIGTFGISRDITERKAIEGSILQANEELEKTNLALQAEIAERKRAEEELAHERELFRTMMDNSSDHIYFKDSEHRFLLINRALADYFHLADPAEAVGKTEFEFSSTEHARQAHAGEEQILADGKSITELEEKRSGADDHEMWISTSKYPMRNSDGLVIGTFGISRDITERKNMDFAIQLANDKLSIMVNWLEGRNREISVLNEMGSALEACRSLEEAYPVISREMARLISVDTGKLYLKEKETGRMACVARWGTDPGPADSFSPEACKGVQSKQVYNTAYAVQLGVSCRHLDPPLGADSVYLCVPLLSQGEAIGLLHLRGKRKEGSDAAPDLKQQLAVMAADHISLALANLTLRETLRLQSIRDALTGLFNRRYLEESLSFEINNTRSRGTTLGVIMLDVDWLKQVNDNFGHEAGDAMLQALGRWLHANVRTGDISCRYGGDEFVLILPNATLEATTQRAHQICEGIRRLPFDHQGRSLGTMSVSVGVAAFPIHGETRDALLAAVDSALYKAKEQGKDRVVIAGE